MTKKYLVAVLLAIFCNSLFAAKNDWAEGTAERADGASRDYYNRAGLLKWKNHNGDWRDAANVEQGSRAFSTSSIVDDDMPRFVEWNATTLVQAWIDAKYQNQGMLLHAVEGGASHFYSREYADDSLRPQLIVSADKRKITLAPVADTHLDRSTYRSLGDQPVLKVTGKSNNTLLRFDLSGIQKATRIDQATLRGSWNW